MFGLTSPRKVFFGWGALDGIKEIEGKRAYIVTDDGAMRKLGFVEKVITAFNSAGIDTMIFEGVEADPGRPTVNKAVKQVLESRYEPDLIVGLGGGSSIDAAKAVWVFYEHPDLTWEDALGVLPPLRRKAKFVGIPTTSGTGTEVSRAAVVTNREMDPPVKQFIFDQQIIPDYAMVDSELAAKMPSGLAADTGLDALVHAIEAYTCSRSNPVTESVALRAATMVLQNLRDSFSNGRDARDKMHIASAMAGMAFANSGLGIAHGLAHQMGSQYGLHHGRGCGIVMPYVIAFNAAKSQEAASEYCDIVRALGYEIDSIESGVKKLIDEFLLLEKDIKVALNMKDAGIPEKEFLDKLDVTAYYAEIDGCSSGNPIIPTLEEYKKVYKAAYYGDFSLIM